MFTTEYSCGSRTPYKFTKCFDITPILKGGNWLMDALVSPIFFYESSITSNSRCTIQLIPLVATMPTVIIAIKWLKMHKQLPTKGQNFLHHPVDCYCWTSHFYGDIAINMVSFNKEKPFIWRKMNVTGFQTTVQVSVSNQGVSSVEPINIIQYNTVKWRCRSKVEETRQQSQYCKRMHSFTTIFSLNFEL